jgi:hypothetical protein
MSPFVCAGAMIGVGSYPDYIMSGTSTPINGTTQRVPEEWRRDDAHWLWVRELSHPFIEAYASINRCVCTWMFLGRDALAAVARGGPKCLPEVAVASARWNSPSSWTYLMSCWQGALPCIFFMWRRGARQCFGLRKFSPRGCPALQRNLRGGGGSALSAGRALSLVGLASGMGELSGLASVNFSSVN